MKDERSLESEDSGTSKVTGETSRSSPTIPVVLSSLIYFTIIGFIVAYAVPPSWSARGFVLAILLLLWGAMEIRTVQDFRGVAKNRAEKRGVFLMYVVVPLLGLAFAVLGMIVGYHFCLFAIFLLTVVATIWYRFVNFRPLHEWINKQKGAKKGEKRKKGAGRAIE